MTRRGKATWGYAGIVAGALALAVVISWLPLASAIDGEAYDWLFRLHPPHAGDSAAVVLAIDEETLAATGDMRNLRATLAGALDRLRAAEPKVVAIDVLLPQAGDAVQDAKLAAAFARTPNLILASDLIGEGRWQEPAALFARHAAAVGHVHAAPDPVSRVLPLEKAAGRTRRFALALEAARLYRGIDNIEESPDGLRLGDLELAGARRDSRPMKIRYRAAAVPAITPVELERNPRAAERARGKAVFAGLTALSAARDRLMTPFGETLSGVEIHANAFNTLVSGRPLRPVLEAVVLLVMAGLAAAAGICFATLAGWPAYAAGAGILALSHAIPHVAFRSDVVFPYTAPVAAAWLTVGAAAAWQYFVVRRQLRKSEADKARYQQAIHFVTHEMRSPLTAIQGSSELIGRYNLNDEKRRQVASMINSESKRLARMVQTFLDIERLTEGEMELKHEHFEVAELIDACVARAGPLAARKQIALIPGIIDAVKLTGDRELMEYALYNLLTNAVKYSPPQTTVAVEARLDGSGLRIAVRDQGIGMDAQELRRIFTKFYRTRRAEQSGEVGTGIGLSLVEQIVTHHGGRMEVTSTPGVGSCFTMVLPRGISVPAVPASGVTSN